MKKKIKQYSFWTGLAGAVVILITTLSKAFGFEFQEEIVADIIMAVCGVLVVFGVVNAPTKEELPTKPLEEEIVEEVAEEVEVQPEEEKVIGIKEEQLSIEDIKEEKNKK